MCSCGILTAQPETGGNCRREEPESVKKLSIVIPVYNVERYLAACIDSCLETERTDEYEIVAVDDGSTDRSGSILEDYVRKYPTVLRSVRTENGGLGHARNTGLDLAGGAFVLFLDSDDRLSPGALEQILNGIDGDFDLGLFDFTEVDEQGRALRTVRGCERKEGCFTLDDYPELIFAPPNVSNKIWRRQIFLDSGIRFPDRIWFEDLATVPKLYLHTEKIRYFSKSWYLYLQRSSSIMKTANAERNREMLIAIKSTMDYYRQHGSFEQREPQLCYLAAYHELLTSTTRVNLIDPKSPVQDALREDFLSRFPNYGRNPYINSMPAKHRLLIRLIAAKRLRLVHLLMKANQIVRRGAH